jgi:hypothetical protein
MDPGWEQVADDALAWCEKHAAVTGSMRAAE